MAVLTVICAQAQVEAPAYTSNVRVVTLLASVHDKSTGVIVEDLTKDDFRLEEDGRPQQIRYFSRESDLPLVLPLLIDTSQSMRPMFEAERTASNRFFRQVLREDRDVAAVVHFDVAVGTLQDFTSSREELASGLDRLRIPPRRQVGTLLYESIRNASENLMKNRPVGKLSFSCPTVCPFAIQRPSELRLNTLNVPTRSFIQFCTAA